MLKVAVSGKSVLVTATVPKGWQSVTLESRSASGSEAWVPRAVMRASRLPASVSFRVPASLKGHAFRVRGEARSKYPLTFFNGKRVFAGKPSGLWRSALGTGGAFSLAADGNLMAGAALPAEAVAGAASRTVVESDIWTISGDTLYFFNQYRGLQVIDVSDPDAPALRGTLALPAAGDQLYALDPGYVALLARRGDAYDASQVLVADVSAGEPRVAASVPLEGAVFESRLVGRVLYVAAQVCLEVEQIGGAAKGTTSWQWGTALYAIDLASPAAPVLRDTLWLAGPASAVLATDRLLFVAAAPPGASDGSLVHVIDIASDDGVMREAGAVAVAGQVKDKFKMNLSGEVFTAVTERFAPAVPGAAGGAWLTVLETFSLADAAQPARLGRLELAPGERLFATRFDGARAYAVTFRQIDPLWIVDLSDPASPRVAGEVEVPGWSTYICPLGDRLVTVGVEEGRAAVSLFDVADPASAGLLSRVRLGEGYSWSEANQTEKALSIFAEEGLVLLPYEGYEGGVAVSRVQVIDLSAEALAARGVIDQACAPRRTALHRGRVLSLSGKSLLTVDLADRDAPSTTASTELSWAVNRVFPSGDYVLEVESPGAGYAGGEGFVRVVSQAKPEAVLERFSLGTRPVAGACVRDGRLHVLQRPAAAAGWGGGVIALEDAGEPAAAETNLVLTAFDLGALPALAVAGRAEAPADPFGESEYEAVWPSPGLLVWVGKASPYGICRMMDAAVLPVAGNPATASGAAGGLEAAVVRDVAGSVIGGWWPWWGSQGVRLLAFEASGDTLAFAAGCRVNPPSAWGFGSPFAAKGLVYLTHEESETVSVPQARGGARVEWRARTLLDVVDFTSPSAPTARAAVDVPGQLAGLSEDGGVLYVLGGSLAAGASDSHEALHACAYDGVEAYLVASLPLPKVWPRPVRVEGGIVFVGRAAAGAGAAHQLESWRLSEKGFFVKLDAAALAAPAAALAAFGPLVAAQQGSAGLALFDAADPSALRPCGAGTMSGGVWLDLSRAAGALGDGVWVPLDDFGLGVVPAE